MEPSTRKIFVPIAVAAVACLVVMAVVLGPGRPNPKPVIDEAAAAAAEAAPAPTTALAPGEAGNDTETTTAQVISTSVIEEMPLPPLPERAAWGSLHARASQGSLADRGGATPLGSLDPTSDRMQINFASKSAGIDGIVFSDFWRNGKAKRQAASHVRAVEKGESDPPPMPEEDQRFVLQTAGSLYTASGVAIDTPILAVHSIQVIGWGETAQSVVLFGDVWSEIAPGVFETEVFEDGTDEVVLRIRRSFVLFDGSYDITLSQHVENESALPLKVRWTQYGPGDLALDETSYLKDIRRFHFGYLMNPTRDPKQLYVLSDGQMVERATVIDMAEAFHEDPLENSMWPNEPARAGAHTLSWFGATNRYFALCVHAPFNPPGETSKVLSAIDTINPVVGGPEDERTLMTELIGQRQFIEPGATAAWDMGVYAGPLERSILNVQQPYESLGMGGLILYLMSGCCSFCTFTWLASFMIMFLSGIHDVVFDWGVSIIVLVMTVRLLLHPITRKGQVLMQRNAKVMGELKPELDDLRKRYENEPDKLRKEQMALMQEKGMNPLGCASGMFPMFLQMPVWIALYAVLFFAFELRQQPAFYGVFQMLDGWAFLGDLSAPDNFIDFGVNYEILFFQFTGINLLPLMMGFVFYFQQKYMTPPSQEATMTDDQKRQQKMMKIMMLVLFPIMLYGAPSGLTLYILTSSIIGTIESKYIRSHIKLMDERKENEPDKPVDEKKTAKAKAKAEKRAQRQDKMGKAYEQMLDNAKRRQEEKKENKKTFKKRQ